MLPSQDPDHRRDPAAVERRIEPSLSAHIKQVETLARDYSGGQTASATFAHNAAQEKTSAAQYLFIISDLLSISLGYVVALGLSLVVNSLFFNRAVPWVTNADGLDHLTQLAALSVGILLWFENAGHYRTRIPFWMEAQKIVNVCLFALMADVFLQFALKQDFSRLWLISSWVFTALIMIAARAITRGALQRKALWQIRVLLVGDGPLAAEALSIIEAESSQGYTFAAQLEHSPDALMQGKVHWRDLCAQHRASFVMLAMDGSMVAATDTAISQLLREGVPFSVFSPLRNLPAQNVALHHFFGQRTFLMLCDSNLEQPLPRLFKRSFDVVAAGGGLLVLGLPLLLLALLIRLDGGPALFKHKRLGLNGKSFGCLKFRSMAPNSDEVLHNHLAANADARHEWEKDRKLKNDPRITRFGAFLRRSSLDELPQLINVLRGEMSLVGPRPIVVAEASRYNKDINHYYRVLPGLTGLWQVSGRNDVSYAARVQMDAWYVRNWSLWLDITIICKTFPALLARKGAY